MKTPCEIVVWYVLPTIRREMARELVTVHKVKQSQVARLFGVTDAAISQYLSRKRGSNSLIEESKDYGLFMDEIRESSRRIALSESDMSIEMCRICTVVKSIGLLAEIYSEETGYPAPKCAWGTAIVQQDM